MSYHSQNIIVEARRAARRIDGALARHPINTPVLRNLKRRLAAHRRDKWGRPDLAAFLATYSQWIDHNCKGAN